MGTSTLQRRIGKGGPDLAGPRDPVVERADERTMAGLVGGKLRRVAGREPAPIFFGWTTSSNYMFC